MVRLLESNGYDVSYTSGVDTDRRGARAARAPGLHVGRSRRVLVGPAARQRRGGPGRRREPRVLQRQRDLLEDPLGEQHRRVRHAVPHPGHLQGDARERRDRPPGPGDVDRHLAGPAVQPTRRRRRPGERAERARSSRSNCCAINMVVGSADGKMRFWRNTRGRQPGRNATTTTVGTNTIGYEWDEDLDNGFRPAGADPAVRDDGQRRHAPGLRHQLRQRARPRTP